MSPTHPLPRDGHRIVVVRLRLFARRRVAGLALAAVLALQVATASPPTQAQTPPAAPAASGAMAPDIRAWLGRLEAAKVLRPATAADLRAWVAGATIKGVGGASVAPSPAFPLERTFVALGQIDLGAGLYGPDAIGLVLPKGAPLPAGRRGDGPIYRLDNFMCRGRGCPLLPVPREEPGRGGRGSASDREIRRFTAGCAIALPRDAVVHAVGAYESKVPAKRLRVGNRPGRIEIAVTELAAPVALLLSAYEGIEWRIGVVPGARVAGVYASGHHELAVIGLDPSVPVLINVVDRGQRLRSECREAGIEPALGYQRADVLRALDPVSRAVFGRDIDDFDAAYTLDAAVVGPGRPPFADLVYAPDPGEAAGEALPLGMEGVRALAARGLVRPATNVELFAWLRGFEQVTRQSGVRLNGPALAWLITGTRELPLHPGGWSNVFILPAGQPMPADRGGTWAVLRMDDYSCVGGDCAALLGRFRR